MDPTEKKYMDTFNDINYLHPVRNGRLKARGTCIRLGKSICYFQAHGFDEMETLVTHGTSTLMALPEKGLNLGAENFLGA